MGTIYTGQFGSKDEQLWRVSIKGDTDNTVPGQLDFAGDEPLTIEWDETAKEDVMCSSTATLRVLSPGDRTYAGLYTIEAGAIAIEISRNDKLYWQGTLDPETYEEPYSDTSDYEVELTFNDFGIWDRQKYDMSGTQTIDAILKRALQRAGLTIDVDTTMISTQLTAAGTKMSLADISIRSENWTDEDGELSTLKEVLEGALQPLGLRIMQKNGKIWVYDLNGLYAGASEAKITWHDDDQVMSVDKVANNAKITFSPYAKSQLTEDAVYTDVADIDAADSDGDVNIKCYYSDTTYSFDDGKNDLDNQSFKIFTSKKGRGLAAISADARYFKVVPLLGGEDAEGVAYGYKDIGLISGNGSNVSLTYRTILKDPAAAKTDTGDLMTTHKMWLPKVADAAKYRIRLTLEMLADARYNPYEDGDDNAKGDEDETKITWTVAYVNAKVNLYNKDNALVAAFDNQNVSISSAAGVNMTGQGWKTGMDAQSAITRLEYYDPEDFKEGCAICAWKKNRQYIGFPAVGDSAAVELRESFRKLADGQYIPYPADGGWLEVTIMNMLTGINWSHHDTDCYRVISDTDWARLKWLLYKAPQIEVVKSNVVAGSEESDDIEYTGSINKYAKEEIGLDTTCGTMSTPIPTSKGCYVSTLTGLQLSTLYRAGRTAQAEQLLLNTLYSQYAGRKTKLSGTANIISTDLCVMTDGAQGNSKFIVLSEVQDCGEGTSEITAVELSPDEYTGVQTAS